MSQLTVEIKFVSGLSLLDEYVRLPMVNEATHLSTEGEWVAGSGETERAIMTSPTDKTQEICNALIASGDEHAKLVRFINAHMEIRAPRFWWAQMDTYRIGTNMYSGSTMHNMPQDLGPEDFVDGTPPAIIRAFNEVVKETLGNNMLMLSRREKHHRIKCALPEGFMQTRIMQFSYQTLRRIWRQRHNHRMREWQEFIEYLHDLPLADELIFVEPRKTRFTEE